MTGVRHRQLATGDGGSAPPISPSRAGRFCQASVCPLQLVLGVRRPGKSSTTGHKMSARSRPSALPALPSLSPSFCPPPLSFGLAGPAALAFLPWLFFLHFPRLGIATAFTHSHTYTHLHTHVHVLTCISQSRKTVFPLFHFRLVISKHVLNASL